MVQVDLNEKSRGVNKMTLLRIQILYAIYACFILLAVMPSVQANAQSYFPKQGYPAEQYVPENIRLGMLHPASDLFQQWLNQTALPYDQLSTPEDLQQVDLILINTAYPLSKNERAAVVSAFYEHKILIFDNATNTAPTTASKAIANIIGLGLTDRFVIAHKPKSKPLQVQSLTFAPNTSVQQQSELLLTALKQPLTDWSQQRSIRVRRQATETDDENK
jgi:hypothetical protein